MVPGGEGPWTIKQLPPETIVFLIVAVLLFNMLPPTPPSLTLLPERVELLTSSGPELIMPPPPPPEELLPERVELLTSSVPPRLNMPPPPPPPEELLPERVELVTVSVPALGLCMPPPDPPTALPLATVSLLRVSFALLPTSNTRYLLSPLTVILALPPSMISPALSVMVGNCEPTSVMVAGETRLKVIVSWPTPAGQSAEPDWS